MTAGNRTPSEASRDRAPDGAGNPRRVEARLLAGAVVLTGLAGTLLGWSVAPDLPPAAIITGVALAVIAIVAHVTVRYTAPDADPALLPLAFLLNGLGLVFVRRVDLAAGTELAAAQMGWTAVTVGVMCVALLFVSSVRPLARYQYTFGLLTIVLLVLPVVPLLSAGVINGAQLWIDVLGMRFQPGEIAKLTGVLFLAGYLARNRDVLSVATQRVGPLLVPAARHLAPVFVAALGAMVIMAQLRDLGSALLFFGTFMAMLYVATGRLAYPAVGGVLFAVASYLAYVLFAHVRVRVNIWIDPWADVQGSAYQLVQSLFALGTGGLTGTGLGLGRPQDVPFSATDAIFVVIGEELGLLGATAVLVAFLLLVARSVPVHPPGDRDPRRAGRRLEGRPMNRSIGRVGAALFVLFGALFVNLNVITLIQADDLATHPANRRLIVQEYGIARGPIVVGDEAIASSTPTEGELRYLRTYAAGPRYAHLTGYYSVVLQRSGLEAAFNESLTGRPTEVVAQNLGELLGSANRPGNAVQLTIDAEVQEAAQAALGDREGAVVVIDPRSGAVLASYANPTYDPNPLSSHDRTQIRDGWDALRDREDRPLVDRATREIYPPGSTFKLIVAAAALEAGMTPDALFPDEVVYDVPQTTADIGNFSGGACGNDADISLHDAFAVSCNTVFARLGVELGDSELIRQAERFGFNRAMPYELSVSDSVIPSELDVPQTAQSAIGQRDVRATPMHLALIAASIANGGELRRPHVVANVRNPEGELILGPQDGLWKVAVAREQQR
ncbi:MAG: FtsW/RodA/SpoVE family cell cycle protein [Intrasporangiaceae bacterium]|nr:FtsW/RodA/SpoVE family cell cycle protein [Intrasporangiaceae bacterium]